MRSDNATARRAGRPRTTKDPSSARATSISSDRGRWITTDRSGTASRGAGLDHHGGEATEQLGDARTGDGRDGELGVGVGGSGPDVGLRPHHEPGSVEELRAVSAQLGQEDPLLGRRREAIGGGEVEQDHQGPGPLDVAEETVTEAASLRRPLHQARDVGHDELRLVTGSTDADHAEVGLERGEGVVGHLGTRGGDA